MISYSRPPLRNDEKPLELPRRPLSAEQRRFLKAAIKALDAMHDWWLEKQAIWLEYETDDDD